MTARQGNKTSLTTAVILAAGRGTKIWPYGDTQPKAVLPVANRAVCEWQYDLLIAAGIKEIVVVVGHLEGEIRAILGGKTGVKFTSQSKPTGTADALLAGLNAASAEQILVVYGDTLWTPEDLKRLLERHANAPQSPTLLAGPLETLEPQDWLCPSLADGMVTSVLGHPREGRHRFAGLMAMPRNFAETVARVPEHMSALEVGVMPVQEREMLDALNLHLRAGGEVKGVVAEGLVLDLDKPWHILEATDLWLRDQVRRIKKDQIHPKASVPSDLEREGYLIAEEGAVLTRDVKIKGTVWIGAGAQLIDGAIVCGAATIGAGAKVHQYCQIGAGTMIGKHCIVGHGAEFDGVLMDGAYSYHYGEYWGVLGRGADLGAATVCGNLRFDDLKTTHRTKGRREVPNYGANAAYLGDYVRTGVNAILMPGVKVGPYSVIGAGVILNDDVPNRSLVFAKQELVTKSWGPERYGW